MLNLKKKIYFVAFALFLAGATSYAAKQRGFAIVIDPKTYNAAKTEVDAYAQSIEKYNKLKTFVVVDKWGVPDSIRNVLQQMYNAKNAPIEGAVFIGDIPVAMIRDAQHLTTAFKMNQKTFPWVQSSVPSDRFYDDFGLRFDFIKSDTARNHFFYTLRSDGNQYLEPAIYTARIPVTDANESSKYEKVRRYLKKAVKAKETVNPVDNYFFFSGNGFISESLLARIDEKIAIYENFPMLRGQRNAIEYIDHKRDIAVKPRVMNEMQRTDMDIAILHHHGDTTIQYLNNYPTPYGTKQEIESIQLYLRIQMRHGLEHKLHVDTIKSRIAKRYGRFPDNWFDGATDPAQTKKDSLLDKSLDLFVSDFSYYTPNTKMVLLDACFNGAFHLAETSIAEAYITGEGETMNVLANSVNVIQDKWTDRYLGLMALGMRSGNFIKYNTYLEYHLFGDPTYTFTATNAPFDINEQLVNGSESFWKKQLNSPYPAVQNIALSKLAESGKNYSDLILQKFKTSPYNIVRLGCLVELAKYNDKNFIECLDLAVDDNYEMTQRFAINYIAKSGDERLIPALVRTIVKNNTGERIEFNVKQGIALFDETKMKNEFEKQFAQKNYVEKEYAYKGIKRAIEVNANKWMKDIAVICDDSSSVKKKLSNIRQLRNNMQHNKVTELLTVMNTTDSEEIMVDMLEAFGWFNLSWEAPRIKEAVLAISKNEKYSEAVLKEAEKTVKRLENRYTK